MIGLLITVMNHKFLQSLWKLGGKQTDDEPQIRVSPTGGPDQREEKDGGGAGGRWVEG